MRLRANHLTIAILVAAGLSWASAGVSAGYSTASLTGTCIWLNVAVPTTTGQQAGRGPATTVSPITFDGNGHITLDYYINYNGTFAATPNLQGTYTVDPSGQGTLSFLSPASNQNINFTFLIEPDGDLTAIHSASAGKTLTDWVTSAECTFSQ